MSDADSNLDGITDVMNAYVVTRELPDAPISTREFRTSRRTWSKKIEEAKVYEDIELASQIHRFAARNTANFFQKNGYAVPTRFAHTRLGDIVDQLFKGDKDVVSLTQGLSTAVYQPRRDFRDFKRPGTPD
jgi:hypothetical protein